MSGAASDRPSHLSFSQINRYLHCPEQYRLYYIENLRLRIPSASLVFGSVVHRALAALFRDGLDPAAFFAEAWSELESTDMTYGRWESWERLQTAGKVLLERFVQEEMPRISDVEASERAFELDITTLDLPLIGIIDLVGRVDDRRTVIDFKTSGSSYGGHEATLSDQLTTYHLAEPEAEQTALCVLVKTKKPSIEWHVAERDSDALAAFLAKARLVEGDIAAGRFFKRPGIWCKWCDFLPACTGDEAKVADTLVQIH